MRMRLSDEKAWSHEFSASAAEQLRAGVREAWQDFAAEHGWSGDPAMALRMRLGKIERWLDKRLAGRALTNEQRLTWKTQAEHWRFKARRALGGDVWCSPLHLHVQGPSGRWYQLDPAKSYRVAYGLPPIEATELLGLAGHALERARASEASCGDTNGDPNALEVTR
jgi:hypothetical protein